LSSRCTLTGSLFPLNKKLISASQITTRANRKFDPLKIVSASSNKSLPVYKKKGAGAWVILDFGFAILDFRFGNTHLADFL
jgi:hypothetical protein